MSLLDRFTGGGERTRGDAVLIVDDESDIRKLLSVHLKHIGLEVHAAASAEEAVEMVAKGTPYGLFILDINMPGETGIEMAKGLRASEAHKLTPIIILTGVLNEDGCLRVEQEVPNLIALCKPFNSKELKEMVLEILEQADA